MKQFGTCEVDDDSGTNKNQEFNLSNENLREIKDIGEKNE